MVSITFACVPSRHKSQERLSPCLWPLSECLSICAAHHMHYNAVQTFVQGHIVTGSADKPFQLKHGCLYSNTMTHNPFSDNTNTWLWKKATEFLMKHRREGGSPKPDVTKIAYVIKAAKQYENGRHLRPAPVSIIYGNGFFLHLMAIRSSIKNLPPLLLPLCPQIRNYYIILWFLF